MTACLLCVCLVVSLQRPFWRITVLVSALDVDGGSQIAREQPLVLCSFVLSEIGGGVEALCEQLDALWLSTRKVLVLVEAGTVDGFNLIQFARSYLLSKYPPSNDPTVPGTYTVAPCPHDLQCPMSTDNVCRFLQRIDRHQVPTRSVLFADKKRTEALMQRIRMKQVLFSATMRCHVCLIVETTKNTVHSH